MCPVSNDKIVEEFLTLRPGVTGYSKKKTFEPLNGEEICVNKDW